VQGYFAALEAKAKLEAITAKKAKEQKRLAAKKRAMQERHRAMRAKIKAQEDAIFAEVARKHSELREAARNAALSRGALDEAAEKLVLEHGSAPLEYDGLTYDFGCYGSKVYLVPRVKRKTKRLPLRT
jgi:hypothetical protein